MVGGWTSFSGRFGHAGYYDTPVEEALPVTCLKGLDDRVETPEGVHVTIKKTGHPIVKGIPWQDSPVFEGFNRILPKEGAEVLAKLQPISSCGLTFHATVRGDIEVVDVVLVVVLVQVKSEPGLK